MQAEVETTKMAMSISALTPSYTRQNIFLNACKPPPKNWATLIQSSTAHTTTVRKTKNETTLIYGIITTGGL